MKEMPSAVRLEVKDSPPPVMLASQFAESV
jgi:hypothetical protein